MVRMKIQLESHHEQQQRDAQFSQKVDLIICRHPAEDRRTHQDAYGDEGDNQWLAQTHANGADDGCHQQQHCHFSKDITEYRIHDSVTLAVSTLASLPVPVVTLIV
jgi:hypothetical protein